MSIKKSTAAVVGNIGVVAIYMPTLTVGTTTSGSISVTSKVSNYASCTANDFVVEITGASGSKNLIAKTLYPLITKTYNASTGTLTFTAEGLTISNATVYYVG